MREKRACRNGGGKKQVWKCSKGCKNDKVACEHLEKLLPKEDGYSLLNQRHNYAGTNVDKHQPAIADRAKEKADFIKRVGEYLTPVETDILVLRYVYDEQYSVIAKELKLLGAETAIRIHNEALQKLKGSLRG